MMLHNEFNSKTLVNALTLHWQSSESFAHVSTRAEVLTQVSPFLKNAKAA